MVSLNCPIIFRTLPKRSPKSVSIFLTDEHRRFPSTSADDQSFKIMCLTLNNHRMFRVGLNGVYFRLAAGSLMYLGRCEVEMLTGPSAIQRTVEQLSSEEAAKKFTTVSFKVTPQGMTVTDNERK